MFIKTLTSLYHSLGGGNQLFPQAIKDPAILVDHVLRLQAYESAKGLTIAETNRVSSWKDINGRFEWGQGINSQRPFWDNTHQTPNGKNAVYYNGGKFVIKGTSAANDFFSNANGQTIILVVGDTTTDNQYLFSRYDYRIPARAYQFLTNYYCVHEVSDSGFDDTKIAFYSRPAGWNILMARWKPGVETAVYVNGNATPIGTATVPANSISATDLANSITGDAIGEFGLNVGSIAEVTIYNRAITNVEWETVNTILRAEWFL